ncbi:T9SS type A sorting domain-containing protein [Fibrobacter sp.]|uniref:T9SS type A sorting domain-containing protein n=1 Tax=Fibrobacter sp. TaxID=35828 RepID=UPI0025C35760|nr:T9SS type A sorting domain-containing protein [Fibrobacter sp.]MBR3073040.1 T9SS type A sorting domain-containing protein [Fibrobacter sp.]
MNHFGLKCAAMAFAMVASAQAFTLTGKVSDESGKAIEKASVELLKEGLKTTTDAKGEFKIFKEEKNDSIGGSEAIHVARRSIGYVSVMNGVLSYSQSTNEPVRVQIFDAVGSRILNETLQGKGTLDMQSVVKAQGSYFARVSVGSAQSTFRFTSNGNYKASFGEAVARGLAKEGDGDSLRVIATDYDTLTVTLSNLDTNLTLKLKKTVKQPEYAYGWGLKNDPVPTRGCGKDTKLDYKYRGDKPYIDFKWSKGTRTVRIDIPKSYDKNKPYKLIFGMQCMGGWAGGVQDEGYYGLKPFDKEESVIFVAPEGNGNQAPWAQDDYLLFDELLAMLEGNFCIDSSRVFSTGFSYGSMFSNGLSWNHQDVLRAVAVYETAERNIWLPQRKKMGIGWMGVLGLQDDLCRPEMGRAARDIILELNSEGGKAKNERAQEYGGNGPHLCYDYKTVEERFPVRWCTQNGGHIWDHKDPGQRQSWVPETTWDFFNKF